MINATSRAHYVKHNQVTRVPRAFIYLDSEAYEHADGSSKLQTFRLAVAALDRRTHHRDGWREREWQSFTTTDELWDWIDKQCQQKARTVLVAHKLDYDMRLTGSLAALIERGWQLEGIRLDGGQAWASWKHGKRTLVMVDSLSWVNMSLERIGALIGIPKLDLPAWDDTYEAWLARCTRDVEIMAAFFRRLVDWVRSDDLGNWKPTGAGQAWAAYRHRFMSHRLLVHDDMEAREAERVAGWTGRCEAWRIGRQIGGPFTEWDYSTAYARIGAECDVPVQLVGELTGRSLFSLDIGNTRHAVLAECEVVTDVPTVPARLDKRIVWPVGTFTTTLWDTEIQLARENGATVNCTRAWFYRKAPAIADFCTWCLDIIEAPDADVDPIVRAVVKHWSRALIGRFASRYSRWEEYGRMPWDDIALGWINDADGGDSAKYLQLGTQLLRESARIDANDCVPAIMTWTMAECRARIWRSAQLAGLDHVLYLDTDSLIVDREGHNALAAANVAGFRVKSRWQNVEILGPRQLVLQGQLRAAGIPRGSTRVSADTWEGEVWSMLATSIGNGEADVVRITPRRVKVAGTDSRRLHAVDGSTYPIAL